MTDLESGPSSFDDTDDAVLRHPSRSALNRVILLCPSGRPDRRSFALVGTE